MDGDRAADLLAEVEHDLPAAAVSRVGRPDSTACGLVTSPAVLVIAAGSCARSAPGDRLNASHGPGGAAAAAGAATSNAAIATSKRTVHLSPLVSFLLAYTSY